jgi:two-component system alkaline phosphatase synthesis response regulator PhoP
VPPKRVLVVDDEEDIRVIAEMSLQLTHGWEIATASCAREGLVLARNWRPDAILLDVMMPDMNGPTAATELQADASTAGIPIVLLTAKVRAADHARYVRAGVRGVIAKPFDPVKLGDAMKQILGWE